MLLENKELENTVFFAHRGFSGHKEMNCAPSPMRKCARFLLSLSDSVIWSIHGGKKYGYSVNCWFINLIRSITN